VRVLASTRILSGPYCSLLLHDLGADVIKVEKTGSGDDTRQWGPPFLDEVRSISTYFAALNRGKRSLALNFRSPAARDLLDALIPRVAGFSEDPAQFYLRPGDVVEAEIKGIGVLRNLVISWQEAYGTPSPAA
jgi:hypothetical protein